LRRRLAVVLLLPILLATPARSGDEPAESSIKAAIVYNLARVVDWPAAALGDAFVLEVVGADDQAPDFRTLADKEIGGRPLRICSGADATARQMVFLARSEAARCDAVLAACAAQPILTVSEIDDFCERGGMVQLVRSRNRIRLRVNRAAAEAAGLRLSSQLLRVAELVGEGS